MNRTLLNGIGRWFSIVMMVCWLSAGIALAELPAFMQRPSPQHIRIFCYNVNWDSIFEDGDPMNHEWRAFDRSDEFVRMVVAVDPDIVCVQEINFDRDPQDVADILDNNIPLGGGEYWRSHNGTDNVICSRWDMSMLATDTIPTTNRDQAMALIDLPDGTYTVDLYLMNAHFISGGGQDSINRRQQHADAIIHWIYDIQNSGGNINLPADTPIITLGDLNVYDTDPAYHLTTLITGDVVDEGTYGPDNPPDWDGSDNTDALPLHNGVGPDTWTWRNDSGSYNPGALDRIIYTDTAVSEDNSFVLNTKTMSPADLAAAGLQENDVMLDPSVGNYDHVPMVIDIMVAGGCTGDPDCDDDLFCNGAETCVDGTCQSGTDPCPGQMCRESDDTCVNCLVDGDCGDGTFCNGAETCDANGDCQTGSDPCPGQMCRESDDQCVDCLAAADCDDGNPCNGLETCDASGTCQPGSCDEQVTVLDEDFDAGPGDFTYQDDTFGTSNPTHATGSHEAAGGYQSTGGLRVYLGPGQTSGATSGGWQADFNLTEDTTITISLRYRMLMGEGYETNEYGETILDVDGTRHGNDTNDSLVHVIGNGNGGGTDDTGWLSDQFDVPLTAGLHTLTVGAYNNKATASDEWVESFFDDVLITATYAGQCECDDGLFCNGAETCDPNAVCQPGPDPCPGQMCRESDDQCVECLSSGDCPDDGDPCNGQESCDPNGTCISVLTEDCNVNAIEDSCDLADCDSSPWCDDCNTNGTLDVCDIDTGFSEDTNTNGIPDECETDPCQDQTLADCNGDGSINSLDIDPFVGALTDPVQYNIDYAPLMWQCVADCNSDGSINSLDIDPFVGILTGG